MSRWKKQYKKNPSPAGSGKKAADAAEISGTGTDSGEGQPRILDCLLDRKELTQRELADLCMFDVTTMSRTLDKMEQAGLIQRNKNPVSRRSHLISLTEKGKEKGKQVREEFNWLDGTLQKGLTREELETVYGILEK